MVLKYSYIVSLKQAETDLLGLEVRELRFPTNLGLKELIKQKKQDIE